MPNPEVHNMPDSTDIQQEVASSKGPTLVIPAEPTNETEPSSSDNEARVNVTNVNCMLLQDTTKTQAPQHVIQLLEHYDQRTTQAELLVLLVYIVALETGYVEKDLPQLVNELRPLPTIYTFHAENLRYCTRQRHKSIVDDNQLMYRITMRLLVDIAVIPPLQLIAIVSGDLLIVTLSPGSASSMNLIGYSICLPIARYVLAPTSMARPLYARCQNLVDLNAKLRDNLFIPMRNQLLTQHHVQPFSGMLGLPAELYERILLPLSTNQQNIFANVCKDFKDLVQQMRISLSKRRPAPEDTSSSVQVPTSSEETIGYDYHYT